MALLVDYECPLKHVHVWRGLSGDEKRIVKGHLATTLRGATSVCCRVQVGSVPYWQASEVEWRRDLELEALYRKRIDLVFQDDEAWWIVEVKPRASYVALGQVLFYTWHARREYRELALARSMILTDRADDDLPPLCGMYDVRLVQTPGVGVADVCERELEDVSDDQE